MFDVLLTGAETRQTMVTIRSLGRRGIRPFVLGERKRSVGFYSRYVCGSAVGPSPLTDKQAFVDRVIELAYKHKIPYVFPVPESSLIPLDERREEVEEVSKLIAASSETILKGIDKKQALEIATRQDVPITRTLYPTSVQHALDTAEQWGYPVIVKPRGISNASGIAGSFDFKVLYAHNHNELNEIFSQFSDEVFPIVQEYAYGPHTQFNCFVENGEAHSFFQDYAVRMYPLTGGVGTRLESRPVIDRLADQAIKIFKAMNWEGCGQAQFKGPARDGSYRFIEVSVRLPASAGSAVYSGIDTPWMQYCYFTGNTVPRYDQYRIGQATRWMRGDTLAVANFLAGNTPKSADPMPPKIQVFKDWFVDFFRPGLKNYIESFSDPIPGVVEFVDLLKGLTTFSLKVVAQKVPFLVKVWKFVKRK